MYSNWGPLVSELEIRLEEHFGLARGTVATAGSGTSALVGAILASAGRATAARPVALVPAYTFVATGVAARQCGYEIQLVDVDADTWMLEPGPLVEAELGRVGLVVPVAPFGRPVGQREWTRFQDRTGIPVVIDGAASFDAVSAHPEAHFGPVPVAISFHATKSFSTGEGGCVVVADPEAVRAAARAVNFGILGARDASAPGINGKMSEYQAAVGLAEFDGWAVKRAALEATAATYREEAEAAGIAREIIVAPDVGSTYALFCADDVSAAERHRTALTARAVDYRMWYGDGLHRQTCFADGDWGPLPVADDLAPRIIGVPSAPDLSRASIRTVIDALCA